MNGSFFLSRLTNAWWSVCGIPPVAPPDTGSQLRRLQQLQRQSGVCGLPISTSTHVLLIYVFMLLYGTGNKSNQWALSMFEKVSSDTDNDISDVLRSIEEIEESVTEAVLRRRAMPRHKVCTKISIEAASSSERDHLSFDAMTGDISGGGCLVFSRRAILPGDVFLIDFGPGIAADLGQVFARCLRCRFIAENRFELGFRFLEQIDVDYVLDEILED